MRRRGLTRQVFADSLGKSLSWVDKIRNGDRQLDRLSVLRQIARVLDIPLQVLVEPDEAERRRQCPDDREIDVVRSALRRYDAITNVFRPNGGVLPEPDLARLERSVRHGWMAFQVSNNQTIGLLLPDLIRDAQAAVWQLDGDDERAAKAWLAWTYQLTAATAFKLGDAQLGWVRPTGASSWPSKPKTMSLIGNAARWVAHALMYTHPGGDALTLVRSAADRLAPQLGGASASFISAYGMLLLKGSIAAARLHRAEDVRDLQTESLAAAVQLGTKRLGHWSSFGTTNVQVHHVSALADMHGGGRVIEAAEQIAASDLIQLPRERRASHLLDVARGYVQAGRRDAASTMLLDADQLTPEEVRCRRLTRQLITELVHSYPHGSSPPLALARVVRAVGVAV